MTGPTDDQTRRLVRTEVEFQRQVDELDRVIMEVVPALNQILRSLGLVEIQVPARGGLVS